MKKPLSTIHVVVLLLLSFTVIAGSVPVTETKPSPAASPTRPMLFENPELTATVINEVGIGLTFIDHSAEDRFYDIRRTSPGDPVVTYQKTLFTPGSGGLYVFFDYTVQPNTTYTYTVTVTIDAEGYPEYPDVASATVNTADRNPLEYPTFDSYDGIQLTETSFTFRYNNPTAGALTEIYHALEKDGPYTLLATATDQRGTYTDSNLEPGTTYHYTLRSVFDGAVSAFAGQPQITTFKDFKLPDFSAVAHPDTSVQITIHDRGLSDVRYELIREDLSTMNGELIQTFEIPDSGTTVTYFDEGVFPGRTYRYILDVFLEQGNGGTVGLATVQTDGSLQTPYFDFSFPPSSFPCGSEIALTYQNTNFPSETEIWRSLTADGTYTLIATTVSNYDFMDTEVLPHRTYYYKLRASQEGTYSEFSESHAFESGSDFFPPALTATLLPDNTVQFSLQDNSFGEISYDVYGFDRTTGYLNGFFATIADPDSGAVHSRIDPFIEPGHEYFYGVSATLDCDGQPQVGEFGVSITIPDGAHVFNFILVEPQTDQDAGQLSDGATITDRTLNLRVNTNSLTKSIVYFLDGKKYIDNSAPFTLFDESKGNYKNGHFKNGTHTLIATAYSDEAGNGIAGNTISVTFHVDASGNQQRAVNFYPNPVVSQSTLEINGKAGDKARIDVFDHQGNYIRSVFSGNLNSDGKLAAMIRASDYIKGTYILSIEQHGSVETIRFSVE